MHRDDLTVEKSATAAREIDRRTIAKGVAWTVPVVIVATAAPAAAASGAVTVTNVVPTYLPTHGTAEAVVSLTVTVESTGVGNSITFSHLAQGGAKFFLNDPKTFALNKETKDVTITTVASSTLFPGVFYLNYTTTPGGGAAYPVTVDKVSQISSIQRANGGSPTFTVNFAALKNPDSALSIDSVTSARKPGTTGAPGVWGNIRPKTKVDLGTGAVTFVADRPGPQQNDYEDAATVAGTVDGVPFTIKTN